MSKFVPPEPQASRSVPRLTRIRPAHAPGLTQGERSFTEDFLDQLSYSLSTVDLNLAADQVAADLAHFFDADYCHLTLFDADRRVCSISGEYQRAGAPPFSSQIHAAKGWNLLGAFLEQGKIVACPGELESAEEHLFGWGFRSYIAVPIISHDRLCAILGLAMQLTDRIWSDDEIASLRRLVLPLAIAVDNSYLYAAMQQKLRETEALHAVVSSLLSPLPLKALLPRILEVLSREFDLSTSAIGLYDPKRNGIVVYASHGYPPGALDGYPLLPLDVGIIGWVMKHGEALNIGDVSKDRRFLSVAPGVHSEMCVPLEVRGNGQQERIGVLNIESCTPDAFTEDDLELFRSVATQLALVIRYHQLLIEREAMVDELEGSLREFARSLGQAIEKRDGTTHGHVERTERMARHIADRLELSEKAKENLVYGCALHDVGKLGIPDAILLKPAALDEEEWRTMKLHPEIGADIVRPITRFRSIAPIILYHQEKFDGTGYPAGLRGEEIPIESRIIAVIDAYDAMVSKRPYNVPKSHEEALAELRRCSGTQFDPEVVEAFITEIERARSSRRRDRQE